MMNIVSKVAKYLIWKRFSNSALFLYTLYIYSGLQKVCHHLIYIKCIVGNGLEPPVSALRLPLNLKVYVRTLFRTTAPIGLVLFVRECILRAVCITHNALDICIY